MPDLDFRSRASFISSNDGGTPVSRTRSCMNISNSCCLRVSMVLLPKAVQSRPNKAETRPNRSSLVLLARQRSWCGVGERSVREWNDVDRVSLTSGRGVRHADDESLRAGEDGLHGRVLNRKGLGPEFAIAKEEPRPNIVVTGVVLAQ